MPKSSSSVPALRRNQACKQCRKRKLKCDAGRPHCGTCIRQWTAQVAVPPPVGFTHPSEPTCSYDPVDGLCLAPETVANPSARIDLITKEIADLQTKLREARDEQARTQLGSAGKRASRSAFHSFSAPGSRPSSSNGNGKEPAPFQDTVDVPPLQGNNFSKDIFYSQSPRSCSSTLSTEGSPGLNHSNLDVSSSSKPTSHPDPLLGMFFSDWDPHLPDPTTLRRYVDDFFRHDPCGSRILHRSRFISSLSLPPSHPDFPHPALLHAICASASRWSRPSKHRPASSPIRRPSSYPGSANTQPTDMKQTWPSQTVAARARDRFAQFHASKARSYIEQCVTSATTLFPVLQATSILSWWYYAEGRSAEVWLHAGFQARLAIPLGLNYSSSSSRDESNVGRSSASDPNDEQRPLPYPDPPRSLSELEERRRVWWTTVMFDRFVSVGGWLHSIDERDIASEFPLRSVDFEVQAPMPSNPQSLFTDSALTQHVPAFTDSFVLLVKACMVLGKVTDYNTRMNLRTGGEHCPTLLSNPLNPFMAISSPNTWPARKLPLNPDGAMPPGFRALDNLVAVEFLQSLPSMYRSCLGVRETPDGSCFDTDLHLVHLIPHAATILLHNPYSDFSATTQCQSVSRCLDASRAILNAYYLVASTNFDIAKLHPFVNICWYLAAIVQVRLCKRLIEIGDTINEVHVWGEINAIRLAMLRYGSTSDVGTQQETLLQTALSEIISSTSQNQPLTIGVPLYPMLHPVAFQSSTGFHTSHESTGSNSGTRSSIPHPNSSQTNHNYEQPQVPSWLDFGDDSTKDPIVLPDYGQEFTGSSGY